MSSISHFALCIIEIEYYKNVTHTW